jgi:polyhydroxyalkanoate synthesis regulator phasin
MQDFDSSPSVADTGISTEAPASVTPDVGNTSTTTNTPNTDQTSASPSDAAKGESKETLLDAVMRVVKPADDADKLKVPGEGTVPGSDQPQSDGTDGASSEEDLSEDPSKEELGKYHSRTRKRIEKLLDQRNAARDEVTSLRGQAQVAEGLRSYLTTNDIAKEDFSLLLDLGTALRRGDWQTFYQGVAPYMELAEEALGVRLPKDLQAQVQQGHLTTEAARHFSRERYARMLAETKAQDAGHHAQRIEQQVRHQDTARQVEALKTSINGAVSAWEASVRQTDPDYGHKQDAVKNLLWAVVNEQGAPSSPEQAVAIAKEAYRRANEMAARFTPKPRATSQVPSSIPRPQSGVPEPKSLMEAAMQGLARTHRSA